MKREEIITLFDGFMVLVVAVIGVWACIYGHKLNKAEAEAVTETSEPVVVSTFETTEKAAELAEAIPEKKEPVIVWNSSDRISLSTDEQKHLYDVCKKWNVPVAYACAVIQSESHFDNEVVGGCGEVGYMQVHPVNWERMDQLGLNVRNNLDNLECGVIILHENIEYFREFDAATMGYKCGTGRAAELIAEGIILEVCEEVAQQTMYYESVIAEDGFGWNSMEE